MEGLEKAKNSLEIIKTNFEFILKLAAADLSEGQSEEEMVVAISEIIKKTMNEIDPSFQVDFLDRFTNNSSHIKLLSDPASAQKRIDLAIDLYTKQNTQ